FRKRKNENNEGRERTNSPSPSSYEPPSKQQHHQEIEALKEKESRLTNEKITRQQDNNKDRFVNEFTVIDILGIGGFGSVFKANHITDDTLYAVKRIAVEPSEKRIAQSLKEVRVLAKLDHKHIVRYHSSWIEKPAAAEQYDVDEQILKTIGPNEYEIMNYDKDSVFIYIQTQLCKYSLTKWLRDNTTSSSRNLNRMKKWFLQILSGVEYLHGMKLIHRDLKPCNILFVEKDRIKICDMGIVAERKEGADGAEITATYNDRHGTWIYKSPEQVRSICVSSSSLIFV
ncbi:hypothetical protein PENTCL1PPCAC_8692, partial [Pristionchus entomophagus]